MSKGDEYMSIEKAEATVASLEAKRAACVAHGTELADERSHVALAAHTGDAKARKRLDEINDDLAVHGSELASLDAALRAASEKLAQAKQAERDDVSPLRFGTFDKMLAREFDRGLDRFRAAAHVEDMTNALRRVRDELFG
jgi:rubrerythrin